MAELKIERVTGGVVTQSGVIPYRIRRGRLEIALVTASNGPHWTIPKGHIEPDLSPEESAAKEAFEESGLTGDVEPRCLGTYVYEKRGRPRRVAVYALQVKRELKRWPEMVFRKRKWMTVAQAASRVRSAELRCCIQAFEQRVLRRERRTAAIAA